MVVDDDDDREPAPASDAPAGEKTAETPTEQPPEGEQPEGEQAAEATAADEGTPEAEQKESETGEDDEDDGDRKRTRSQRYREQLERLRTENEALRRGKSPLPSDQAQIQEAFAREVHRRIGNPPKAEDFKDDYVGYSHAMQAYVTDKRLTERDVAEKFTNAIETERARVADLVADHKERVAEFRKKVPDYDQVMAKATVPVAPHIERLLLHSEKSEHLTYVLGKDQKQLSALNRMDPESAAREIGRLEGRLSLPAKPKPQTEARKPIAPLRGTGAAPRNQNADVDAYIKKLYGRV